jgi:hypothetical protein
MKRGPASPDSRAGGPKDSRLPPSASIAFLYLPRSLLAPFNLDACKKGKYLFGVRCVASRAALQ